MRQLMNDRHGIVALLSFSNVAVDTFRRDYYLLARERSGSSNSSSVEIDTVGGVSDRKRHSPSCLQIDGGKTHALSVQGHEPFLKGQTVYDGSRPHPTANLEIAIDSGNFKFSARFGYSSVPIHPSDAVSSSTRSGASGACTLHWFQACGAGQSER